MSNPNKIVFLFDVDNTLLDNDRVQADLKEHLEHDCVTGIGRSSKIYVMNWGMSITWERWSASG
jgi:hypothetical protein